MLRVVQSAGRVIRTESDTGVVVLADYRFKNVKLRQQFPEHWQPWVVSNVDQLESNLSNFWLPLAQENEGA